MTTPARSNPVSRFFSLLGSAVAVSAAVEHGARPRARDLRTLGIDPEQFRRIGR